MKCQVKDLCDDLVELGITEITMSFSGLGLAIADYLTDKGIKVNSIKSNKFKL